MEIDPILEKWDRRLNPKNYPQAEGSRAATFTPDSRALSQEIEAQKKRANAHVFGEYENMKLRIQDAQAAPIELPPTAGRRGSKASTDPYSPEPKQLSPEQKKHVAQRQKASMEKAMEDARRRARDVERKNNRPRDSIGRETRGVKFPAQEFTPTAKEGSPTKPQSRSASAVRAQMPVLQLKEKPATAPNGNSVDRTPAKGTPEKALGRQLEEERVEKSRLQEEADLMDRAKAKLAQQVRALEEKLALAHREQRKLQNQLEEALDIQTPVKAKPATAARMPAKGTLVVTVRDAKGLINKDGAFGTSDPYCTLTLGDNT